MSSNLSETLTGFFKDLRHAVRGLYRRPGFTLAVLLSLGLGIGANTAVFSAVDALMLKTLPVEDPDRLVLLGRTGRDTADTLFSYRETERLRSTSSVLSGLVGASSVFRASVRMDDAPAGDVSDGAEAQLVTTDFFSVLGVPAAIGRTFTSEDGANASTPVAVISYGYWIRRFGKDPLIASRVISVSGAKTAVIGVAAKGFFGLSVGLPSDIWLPSSTQPVIKFGGDLRAEPGGNPVRPWSDQDALYWLRLTGRMKPGVTIDRASADLSYIFRSLVTQKASETSDVGYRKRLLAQTLRLESGAKGRSGLRDRLSKPLFVLMGLVALVLLIACANVANLQLARARAQRREMAIRVAIGARVSHLVRQLIAEGLVLALLGASFGLLLALWINRLLISSESASAALALRLDWRVLLFTSVISLLTALLFGLAPASSAVHVDLATAYREGARGTTGGRGWALASRMIIVFQVAGSLLLTIGAGLFVLTLQNLESQDTGYGERRVLVASVDPKALQIDQGRLVSLYEQILDGLASTPGVRSASMALNGAFTGGARYYTISVAQHVPLPDENQNVLANNVTPGYFETMGLRLLQGRAFQHSDRNGAPGVAVINESMAKYYFPDRSPIGQTFGIGGTSHAGDLRIIGVVRDAIFVSLRDKPARMFYICAYQSPESLREIQVATMVAPSTMVNQIRRHLAQTAAELPVYTIASFADRARESVLYELLIARVTGFFSVLALVLASVGLYGLMSYTMARRTNEIGIRIALGADRTHVTWLVMREVIILLGIGVGVGLGVSLMLARFVSTLVFGLSPGDPLTITASIFIIATAGVLAGAVPALKASRVDPLQALQHE
jgi:predicted permease